jgi:hypothetical protein
MLLETILWFIVNHKYVFTTQPPSVCPVFTVNLRLMDVLASSGVAQRDIRMIIQGKTPPWKPSVKFLQRAAKSAMDTSG